MAEYIEREAAIDATYALHFKDLIQEALRNLPAADEWGGSAVRKAFFDEATRKWLEFPCEGPKDITKFVTHYMALPEPPKEV